jgi:hypothetical protein
MTAGEDLPLDGGCTCGEVRYRMTSKPMFVHCCHCRWCQRETGASFALNAMIEADRVSVLKGEVEVIDTPSNSGKGQRIARCPKCRVALWSNYGATTPERATPCALFASVRSMSQTDFHRTFTFSLRRSSHGWCFRRTCLRWKSITSGPSIGRKRVSSAAAHCGRQRFASRFAGPWSESHCRRAKSNNALAEESPD